MFPSLVVIHLPGRALWFCDILSRQYDNVSMERTDTNISKEQAALVPNMAQIKPGAVLTNKELLDLFATTYGLEVLDVSDTYYRYIQKSIGRSTLIRRSILLRSVNFSSAG